MTRKGLTGFMLTAVLLAATDAVAISGRPKEVDCPVCKTTFVSRLVDDYILYYRPRIETCPRCLYTATTIDFKTPTPQECDRIRTALLNIRAELEQSSLQFLGYEFEKIADDANMLRILTGYECYRHRDMPLRPPAGFMLMSAYWLARRSDAPPTLQSATIATLEQGLSGEVYPEEQQPRFMVILGELYEQEERLAEAQAIAAAAKKLLTELRSGETEESPNRRLYGIIWNDAQNLETKLRLRGVSTEELKSSLELFVDPMASSKMVTASLAAQELLRRNDVDSWEAVEDFVRRSSEHLSWFLGTNRRRGGITNAPPKLKAYLRDRFDEVTVELDRPDNGKDWMLRRLHGYLAPVQYLDRFAAIRTRSGRYASPNVLLFLQQSSPSAVLTEIRSPRDSRSTTAFMQSLSVSPQRLEELNGGRSIDLLTRPDQTVSVLNVPRVGYWGDRDGEVWLLRAMSRLIAVGVEEAAIYFGHWIDTAGPVAIAEAEPQSCFQAIAATPAVWPVFDSMTFQLSNSAQGLLWNCLRFLCGHDEVGADLLEILEKSDANSPWPRLVISALQARHDDAGRDWALEQVARQAKGTAERELMLIRYLEVIGTPQDIPSLEEINTELAAGSQKNLSYRMRVENVIRSIRMRQTLGLE